MKEQAIKKLKITFIFVVVLFVFMYGLRLDHSQLTPADILHIEQTEQKVVDEYLVKQKSDKVKHASGDIPILVYHSVSPYYPSESEQKKEYDVEPMMFEQQMLYLIDNGYKVISFDDLAENLINNKVVPKKSIVLTFDDGWQSQYTYAFPILKKYNLTATFFIYTNPIGNYHLFMNWDEIKDLDTSGMTIGGHTKTHPLLSTNLDDKTLISEIVDSKKIIEGHLNKQIDFFAYPFYYFTPEDASIVKEAGYKAARAGYSSIANSPNNIFTLRSIQVSTNIDDFIKDIN